MAIVSNERIHDMTFESMTDPWTDETMSEDAIHTLVLDIMPSDEIRNGRTMGLHVMDGTDVHSNIGRFLEWQVFLKEFNNDLDIMKDEYGPYDPHSVFLVVIDYETVMPAAVIRIIKPNEDSGLKTSKDLANPNTKRNPWYKPGDTEDDIYREIGAPDQFHTIDIGTMAVLPAYRSKHSDEGASALLYSSCVRWSLENGYDYWITVVDRKILTQMQSWGEPFKSFEGKDYEPYLGSKESKPMHGELHEGLQKVKDFDQGVYDLYTKSAGLDALYVLPDFILPDNM